MVCNAQLLICYLMPEPRLVLQAGVKRKRGADAAQDGGPGSPKTPRLSADDFQK